MWTLFKGRIVVLLLILLLLGFTSNFASIKNAPVFGNGQTWNEVKIGFVVSERSYDLGFDGRVHATDYYCYFANETIDELKRRGYAGLYKLSDTDLTNATVLASYDIVWVSTISANASQQTAVQDYVNAGGLAVIGGPTFTGDWTGNLLITNYELKAFANLDKYAFFTGSVNYPFDLFCLKSVPTLKVIDNGTATLSGRGYIMDMNRSNTNLGEEHGANTYNNNPVLTITPRGNGYVAQLAVDIAAMIGGMIAYPMGYTGVSYTGYGARMPVVDAYIYIFNRINTMLLQKKGYFGWAYGYLFKPLVGELPDVFWVPQHDIDFTTWNGAWVYAFENGNGTMNYVDLYNTYNLNGQFNIRLFNKSNPSGNTNYDISTNETKLNQLKSLIDQGYGIAWHVEPWNNATGGNALSYFQYDKRKWDSLFSGYTTPLTLWEHGAGYMDWYIDYTWKDLTDSGFTGQGGQRSYYAVYNVSGRIHDYGQRYTGYTSAFPYFATPKYLNEQQIDFVIMPSGGETEADPSYPINYEYPLNNTAVMKGIYGACLHPDPTKTTISEMEQIFRFIEKLRTEGYIIEYVNPDIVIWWFKDFVNVNMTTVEVDTDKIRVTVQNTGNCVVNDYTVRFDITSDSTAYTDDSYFYYQKGTEFYVVIPSLLPSETKTVTVQSGTPSNPYIKWSGDQKRMRLVNVTDTLCEDEKFTFTVSTDSGVTTTTEICTSGKGKPTFVSGATSWNYDNPTEMLTILVQHASPEKIVVWWSETGESIDGQQYYLWGLLPSHGQPDHGTGYDVGLLNKTRPTTRQRCNCSRGVQFFFDQEGTYFGTYNFQRIYYHFYWGSYEFGIRFGPEFAGTYGGNPDVSKNITDSVGIYYTNASQGITIHSDFRLSVGVLEVNGSVVGDAIYNLTLYMIYMSPSAQTFPMILSPPHDPFFLIFNPPDNTTLKGMDSDGDGLSDYDEMFVYYTDPKFADTYSLGWKDSSAPLGSYAYPWRGYQAFFNDSRRVKVIEFSGTQSKMTFVGLFKHHFVQNATLNLASFPTQLKHLRLPDCGNRGVAIGDVNNDGKNELLIGGVYTGNVRIFNTTTWQSIFDFDIGTQANEIVIGDFLSDAGDEFVLGSAEGNIYVFNSTFQLKWTADIGIQTYALAIADCDNDEANELVIGGRPSLLIYDSSFSVERNITSNGPYAWGLAVGDANNDGSPDITVSSYNNYVNVYNSSGAYQLIERFQALESAWTWARVHVSDIDNDGKNEIVATGTNGVYVWRLEGTDLMSVWNSSYIGARLENNYPKLGSAVVDLDSDGKKEIIVSGQNPPYNGTLYIINSLGKIIYRFNSAMQVSAIDTGDVDNDGDTDIVFGRESSDIVSVYDGLPRNVAVDLGNDGSNEFFFAGLYTHNMTIDIENALNSYLASSSDCWINIPIKVTSTQGLLGLTLNIQYTSFASQDLDDLNNNYKTSNLPYVHNITNGGITALSYSSEGTSLTIESSSGTTSITKIHSGCKGEPIGVQGAASWSYDASTGILTVIVTHSSAQNVEVYWPILGDVNRDGSVDVLDLHTLSKAYGATSSSPNWNPICDLNRDNIINIIDLSTLSENYGKTSNG